MKKLTTEKMVSFFIFISAEGGRQSRDGNCFALIKKPAGGDRADGEEKEDEGGRLNRKLSNNYA